MGVTHIFDVEVRIDGDSKVYQHYLAQKGGDEFSCGVAIGKALNVALYELLEARLPDAADEPVSAAKPSFKAHHRRDGEASERETRRAEIMRAESEGRCFTPPCKIGDWVRGKTESWCGRVEEISINSDGIFLYVNSGGYSFYCRADGAVVDRGCAP